MRIHSANYAIAKCLSVTRRYCVETAKPIIKLFSPSCSRTILIFSYQTLWQYCAEFPLTRASNAGGV